MTTSIGSAAAIGNSVALQIDGKIVVAGDASNGSNVDFAVVRYTATGLLDTSFGIGGKVTTAINSGDDGASSVAIQKDGKIVAAGYSDDGDRLFALLRYNEDGSLDTGFGNGGKVTTAVEGTIDTAQCVAVQEDGRILVSGRSSGPVSGTVGNSDFGDFALLRYNTDGSLDTSFGSGGKVITNLGITEDIGYSLALQPDENIVVAGNSWADRSDSSFAVVRYVGNPVPEPSCVLLVVLGSILTLLRTRRSA